MELHDTLNPKLWDGEELRPEVKEAIDSIVDQFILELGENEIPVKVLDARIVGSNASFNYTENSDIDVHLVVNTTESSCDFDVLTLLYNFFKKSFNDKYDISIHGIPVEMYIEDVNSSAISNGIYSVFKEEWIKFPEPIEVPDIDITDAFAPFEERYNEIINSNDLTGAEELIDDLYLLRKDSISVDGEYGEGNLVFKEFRNRGYLDNLKQMMADLTSKELSLENLNEELMEEVDSIGNTLSEGQSSFFKNSKVRDSGGKLMPVYHGTKDDFTVFERGHQNKYDSGYLGDGFYFTDRLSSAMNYADWKRGNDHNSHTLEVYLNIVNPLIIENKQWATIDLQDALGIDLLTDNQKFDFKIDKDTASKLTEEIKKRGYDGVIYHSNFYDETTYVVFDPNQIKSTTNMTPTSSNNINESDNDLTVEQLIESLSDDVYYRVEIEYDDGRDREGIFSGVASIIDEGEIDSGIRNKLDALLSDLEGILGNAPSIDEPKAIFAYTNDGLKKSLSIINDIDDELNKLGYSITISEINNTGDIAYQDENQIAFVPTSLDDFTRIELTEEINEEYQQYFDIAEPWNEYMMGCVYLDADKPVALLQILTANPEMYLETNFLNTLEITPEYRGLGLSKELLDVATQEYDVKELGVESDNEIAIEIYKKYGFEIVEPTEWGYYMQLQETPSNQLEEDLHTVDWAKEQFANTFKKYTPSDTLLQAKLKDITNGEWEDLLDFVNSLEFPLVIYRGLKLSDISDFDRNDIGVNWTVDEELFFAPESAFSGSNYVIAAVVDEEQIDWGETIQNYIYYSLRPSDGRWAESEVTLKPNFVLSKMIMLKKQDDELVPVEESLLSEGYLDDEERFWDYKTADVNGTEIFDTSRQETSYGEKFIRLADTGKTDSQGRKSKIVQMSPQEYFLACADGFGSSYSAQIRQVADDEEQLQMLNDVIDKYHKRFPLTYLDYSGISFGQEGRHRMYVAGEKFGWDTKHPVLIIYKGDAPNSKQYKDEHEFNKRIKKIYQDSDKYKINDDELIDYLDLDDLEI